MTHETSPQNHIPSPEEINTAFADVQHHNSRHTGLGAGMANILKALIQVEDENPDAPAEDIYVAVKEGSVNPVVEGDMHGELQDMVHGETFARIGVKLEPFGAALSTFGGENMSSTALEPIIANGEVYKEYLTTLSPEEVEDGKMPLLGKTVSMLNSTVRICFDPKRRKNMTEEEQGQATQVGEDALRTFLTIDPEYRRLGIDSDSLRKRHARKPGGQEYLWLSDKASPEEKENHAAHQIHKQAQRDAETYEDLENYVTYWGRDLLPEFIIADSSQYLTPPEKQGFGPAQWHLDGGETRWPDALAFVNQLDQDERTQEFATEVRQGIITSIDTALNGDDAEMEQYVEPHRKDLANVKAAIAGEDFDAERFLQYTAKKY